MHLISNMKQGKLRTYPIKSLTIFLAICFVVSTTMIVLFALPFMKNEQWVIRILIWVFCGIFAVASLIVLCNQLFFYIEVKDSYFIKHIFFFKKKISIKDITKIKNKDGFYDVMKNGVRFASFASNTQQAQQIIVFLERNGVKVEW